MKKILLLVFLIVATVAVVYAYTTSTAGSGTATMNAAYIVRLTRPATAQMIITNATANTVYYKLNDDQGTPTCSATLYDLRLLTNTHEIFRADFLKVNPVVTVGVFCADTTPTTRIVGW